ncbi:MAG: FAD-dependent oxidoreductase [Spirochaetes bacterium]|nr:FAD-dependent oxidoreductase [Spirochaetota bacterium]
MHHASMPAVGIIGGGGTGSALAWDLALRGFRVSLFEQGEFTSGTTGRHHGQLHSGARYAVGDRHIARECMQETLILRRIVPQAIEYNGGFFVALSEQEAAYGDQFVTACNEADIPARDIPPAQALRVEPVINPAALRTVWVPDGSFDAFRVPASFLAAARRLGASLRPFTTVTGISVHNSRIQALTVLDAGRQEHELAFDYVVNAAGAWAGACGRLAGVTIPVTPAAGAMLAVQGRLSDMVISRLAPPGDGDIIVPQRGLSIIGSTQRRAESADGLLPLPEEEAFLLKRADELVPGFSANKKHAVWAAARPLAGWAADDGRSISRDVVLMDHAAEGVEGFLSIVGGKATVLRAMAEQAADRVCAYFGYSIACRTAQYRLPEWAELYRRIPPGDWTAQNPGLELLP